MHLRAIKPVCCFRYLSVMTRGLFSSSFCPCQNEFHITNAVVSVFLVVSVVSSARPTVWLMIDADKMTELRHMHVVKLKITQSVKGTVSRRRRRADVRAQAVVPLCPTLKYSTIHLQYKIKFLIQRFTTTYSSMQLCCEIINNILVVPMLI